MGFRALASMEPCLFRHGKEDILVELLGAVVASMEPCLFRHGKGKSTLMVQYAQLALQWSHVFSDMVRSYRS